MADDQDPIEKLNSIASRNLRSDAQELEFQDYTLYGEYDMVPISSHKKKEMQDALDEVQQVLTPTIQNLRKKSTLMELQDRIYRHMLPYEGQFNINGIKFQVCLANAKNARDSDSCSDVYINQLRNNTKAFAIQILKEY